MSTWDLWGIGIRTDPGRWGGGGGIASAPPSPRRRESGAAMLSSIRARSTSPVTARMSPSGPTWASWNETMSPRRIRRTRDGSPLGSRPYGWSFGKTSRDTSRTARWCVSSASMRRSFCSSARIRSTSFDGNAGSERQSTRIRTVSAAVSRVHRPWKDRTSSPFRNSRVAPIPSRRSASFAVPIRRVPLSNSREVNSARPNSLPSAAIPAGTVPRIAMNGFEGSATDRRIAPFSRTVRSGRFTGGPPGRGTAPRSGAPRRDTGGRPRGPAPAGLSRPSRGAPPRSPTRRGLRPR